MAGVESLEILNPTPKDSQKKSPHLLSARPLDSMICHTREKELEHRYPA